MQKLFLFIILSFCLVLPALCQPLVASFLTSSSRAEACKFFDDTGDVFPHDTSAKKMECDHMTIEFNPQPSPEKYAAHFGLHQDLIVFGYAYDTHAQAVLVYIDPGTGIDYVPSVYNDPTVTISDSGSGLYTTDYSNVLWNRLEAAGIIYAFRDRFGKPYEFVLRDDQSESWHGDLPAYNTTSPPAYYPPTRAYVRHIPYGLTPLWDSVVCVDSKWNRNTDNCDV